MDRFFSKVEKTESCWNWIAAIRGKSGYGAFRLNGKTQSAHRVSYVLHKGEIPEDLLICHSCDNRRCVNPNHLFICTYYENMQDCKNKGRIVTPKGYGFKVNHKPANRTIKSDELIETIKNRIKSKTMTLQEMSIEFNVSLNFMKDLSSGRTYK